MAHLRTAIFVALVAIASTVASAHAQSADSAGALATRESPEYREAVRMGTEEFNLGNYAEARSLFERAHTISPSARTLRGLGLAEFELRNYPQAVRHLEGALAADVKPLSGQVRQSTEALLHRAEGYIGHVRLALEPPHAAVLLNGQPVEQGERDDMVLSVGDHVLEFSATGHASQRRTLHIVGRGKQTLKVELVPLGTAAEEPALAGSERRPNGVPVYRKWWLWTTVGAVAAAGAVATVFLMRRDPQTRYQAVETAGTPPGTALSFPMESAR